MEGEPQPKPDDNALLPDYDDEEEGDWLTQLIRNVMLDWGDDILDDDPNGLSVRLTRELLTERFYACRRGAEHPDAPRVPLGLADVRRCDSSLSPVGLRRLVAELENAGLVEQVTPADAPTPLWAWVDGAELPAWIIAKRDQIRADDADCDLDIDPPV